MEVITMKKEYENKQVYFVGGGLASLAGAAFLVRDCDFPGENIHILESMNILGGSNDGAGDPSDGFIARGGRMLNDETYENTWDLLSSIPSLEHEGMSVRDEIIEFDNANPTHANARLIDKDGVIQDVMSMGFNNEDRMALLKLIVTPEEKIDNIRICDWFASTPHFFETNFWYMWQTTFAFQKWSSLIEFKRYMLRMILEFSRIQTLEGVTRTPYNQYESIILPIKDYLDKAHVDFSLKCTVTDLDFKDDDSITVTAIHYEKDGKADVLKLNEGDLVLVTNGCMTDSASIGSTHKAPEMLGKGPSTILWENIASKKPGLGNPEPFFGNPELSNWESFTVTCKGSKLLDKIEAYTRNKPGSGALVTFKDSSWLMSIVVAAQPHFKNQPKDTTILWGYGLYTNNIGDYVKKPMCECTGEELLYELIHHLHFEDNLDELMENTIVIPCMMPYIDSQFQPRAKKDRPEVVPKGSTNLAMIGQFCEISEDMVFTEEYSVRSARIAVYKLLGLNKPIAPVTPHQYDIRVLLKALNTSFR
ncbi:oleate hydratase [Clostridium tetani]|uniref:oleate hydratase n=1 Tax=Clostridium tetani TaxID=1513 RepID=UPI000627585E|nr:oleate hydratase [Clostridium tetani]RXI70762.1 oleate hydratase [Clostridium tetani]